MDTGQKFKPRIHNAYYSVYNIETDELVVYGEVRDICRVLDITKSCVSKAVTNSSIVRRKYRIYYNEEENDEANI